MREENKLVEMRSLFKEMKSLTERNAAYVEMAKAEQARQEASNASDPQPIYVMEEELQSVDQPNIENVSHEQIVVTEQVPLQSGIKGEHMFADLHDYGWETDDRSAHAEIINTEAALAILQSIIGKPTVVRAVVEATPPESARPQAPVSSALPLPKHRVFALSDNLCEALYRASYKKCIRK